MLRSCRRKPTETPCRQQTAPNEYADDMMREEIDYGRQTNTPQARGLGVRGSLTKITGGIRSSVGNIMRSIRRSVSKRRPQETEYLMGPLNYVTREEGEWVIIDELARECDREARKIKKELKALKRECMGGLFDDDDDDDDDLCGMGDSDDDISGGAPEEVVSRARGLFQQKSPCAARREQVVDPCPAVQCATKEEVNAADKISRAQQLFAPKAPRAGRRGQEIGVQCSAEESALRQGVGPKKRTKAKKRIGKKPPCVFREEDEVAAQCQTPAQRQGAICEEQRAMSPTVCREPSQQELRSPVCAAPLQRIEEQPQRPEQCVPPQAQYSPGHRHAPVPEQCVPTQTQFPPGYSQPPVAGQFSGDDWTWPSPARRSPSPGMEKTAVQRASPKTPCSPQSAYATASDSVHMFSPVEGKVFDYETCPQEIEQHLPKINQDFFYLEARKVYPGLTDEQLQMAMEEFLSHERQENIEIANQAHTPRKQYRGYSIHDTSQELLSTTPKFNRGDFEAEAIRRNRHLTQEALDGAYEMLMKWEREDDEAIIEWRRAQPSQGRCRIQSHG